MATGKQQIRRFQRPHSGLTTLQQERPSNIYKWLILPETRVTDLYFAADSNGLCLLIFTKLSLKVEPSQSKTTSTKTEFYMIQAGRRQVRSLLPVCHIDVFMFSCIGLPIRLYYPTTYRLTFAMKKRHYYWAKHQAKYVCPFAINCYCTS